MLFNSLHFLVFFPLVTLLYFAVSHDRRWFLLLVASCYFYMALIPVYILILFLIITIDYCVGIWIENARGKRRKLLLAVSIFANVGILSLFKYYNFFAENVLSFFGIFGVNLSLPLLSLALPVGLSFHTFQAMSYTIEVYRGRQKAERHFGIYALYVMFYPQLVAGPIERPQNLIRQFYERHHPDPARIIDGLRMMMWGLFKKAVIADRLAVLVNHVYAQPQSFHGPLLLIATFFFAFQIYCDFSGYSEIACGAARVMGFKLTANFDRPYSAKSIKEFWKRWHISLSTWFRDYLYIPLGGNRTSKSRWFFNLAITFLVGGLWHGAKWTYVIWGALNGFYLIFGILTASIRRRIADRLGMSRFPSAHGIFQNFAIFFLICLSWVFFRAENIGDAFFILKSIAGSSWNTGLHQAQYEIFRLEQMGYWASDLVAGFWVIGILLFVERARASQSLAGIIQRGPGLLRWLVDYACIVSILVGGVFKHSPFIYFQF